MAYAPAEKRCAPRYSLVLAVEVIELPSGAKLGGRTSDICRKGCYIDTLNPLRTGSQIRLRITHHNEIFEALGSVVYVSPSLGMGVTFETVTAEEQAKWERWLSSTNEEY
jgi:PilZ domain